MSSKDGSPPGTRRVENSRAYPPVVEESDEVEVLVWRKAKLVTTIHPHTGHVRKYWKMLPPYPGAFPAYPDASIEDVEGWREIKEKK